MAGPSKTPLPTFAPAFAPAGFPTATERRRTASMASEVGFIPRVIAAFSPTRRRSWILRDDTAARTPVGLRGRASPARTAASNSNAISPEHVPESRRRTISSARSTTIVPARIQRLPPPILCARQATTACPPSGGMATTATGSTGQRPVLRPELFRNHGPPTTRRLISTAA